MSLLANPHHDGSPLYVSNPAPALGTTVSVSVRVPAAMRVSAVHVRTTPDAEPRFWPAAVDRTTGGEAWWRAEIEVRNRVTRYRFLLRTAAGPVWLNALGTFGHDVPDTTDFRLVAWDAPPAWASDAVVYEIFPDRFARSPAAGQRPAPEWAIPCDWDTPVIGHGPETPIQFYGGDLDGIIAHLDHVRDLGADAIYLTPIFPARSNHRYNASSFARVDPLLGGDAALTRLVSAAHERGIRLVGDLTTNHCGDAHPWFVAASSDVDAAEREMFYFGESGDYESWYGVKTLPKLNWHSAELRARFLDGPDSVVARWLRPPYGLDGWRVDVANMTGRRGADDLNHEVAALLRRAAAQARPDAAVWGEHNYDATGDLDRDGWHGIMNYAGFLRPVWSWLRSDSLDLPDFLGVPGPVPQRDGAATVATMRAFAALTSWRSLTHSWNLLGSHDSARIRTVTGSAERVKVALGMLMTLPGIPMIFAGDELGLTGTNGEGGRQPMPWHRRGDWDEDTLAAYRSLISLRRSSAALRSGGLRWVHVSADALVYLRESADERMLVQVRRASGEPLRIAGLAAMELENRYGGETLRATAGGGVILPADGPVAQVWRLA